MYTAHSTDASSNTRNTFNTARKLHPTDADVRTANGPDEYSYCHKPDPIFYGGDPEKMLVYGVELETASYGGPVYSGHLARYLHETMGERVYCKHDGSINDGTEIVSHPATLAYHMRRFGWADILGIVDDVGGHGHDAKSGGYQNCGIHVHVGRAALGNTPDARDLCIAKLLILMERFYENELLAFSRREGLAGMATWSKKTNAGVVRGDHRDTVIEKSKRADCNDDRYHALNLTNSNTIEFRIFRSTLRPQTFAAILQLVDAMVRYCKTHTLQQVMDCTFGDIVAICKYPELAAYCIRRHINITTTRVAA